MRKSFYTKTKTQISCAVATNLNSIIIVQFFYFLIPKFQTYGQVLWAYSPVCVGSWWEILKTDFVTTRLIYQSHVFSSSSMTTRHGSSVGSEAAWNASDQELDPPCRAHSFIKIRT